MLERAGCRQRDMQSEYGILGFPLVDVRAQFIIPTRYDDDVVVELRSLNQKLAEKQ